MKTLRIPSLQKIEVVDLPKPVAGEGEVLLRLKYVGFCGSDLNTFLGRNTMAKPNVIPGHEIGAVIEALGEGCPADLHVGQVVTVNPYTNCGHCASCRNGRYNACQNNETLGVQRDGAMRENIGRGQVSDIDTVLVLGCGMVGLGAIIRSVQRGATVIAVDLSQEKLDLAIKAGAAYGINSTKEDILTKVMEYTDGMGADVVIEAVGSPITYVSAIDAVSFTGRVVCIGYAKSDVSFQTKYFVQKELDIRGSRNATPDDFRAVLNYMHHTQMQMEPFISGIIQPEEAQQALEAWAKAPGKVFRILVKFDE